MGFLNGRVTFTRVSGRRRCSPSRSAEAMSAWPGAACDRPSWRGRPDRRGSDRLGRRRSRAGPDASTWPRTWSTTPCTWRFASTPTRFPAALLAGVHPDRDRGPGPAKPERHRHEGPAPGSQRGRQASAPRPRPPTAGFAG